MTPPVAVAVVSAGAGRLLADCLTSLRPDHEAGRAEVWVVDNASTDGSVDLVRDAFSWVRLIASLENLGFGRAVNLVAARTRAPWLATANDDVVVEPGALARLLEVGVASPGVGTVAPRLILPDGSTQHSVYPFPSPAVAAVVDLGLGRAVPRLAERLCLPGAWDPERERNVPWAMAAFALVRREAFAAAGGFDETQWMYAEDLDLGWRLHRAGWSARYVPGARVAHYGGASTEQAFGSDRTPRRMAATYGSLARRRGVAFTWATAAVSWAAHGTRAGLWAVPAASFPRRFAARRDRARHWRDIHRLGLRSRSALLAPPYRREP